MAQLSSQLSALSSAHHNGTLTETSTAAQAGFEMLKEVASLESAARRS